MKLRDFGGVVRKGDKFFLDPRTIEVRAGFNVRDLSTSDARAKLDILKAQIKSQGGVRKPIEVGFDGSSDDAAPFLVDGHRRLVAVMELIAEGEDIQAIPAVQEIKGTNDAGRVVAMLTAPGEPLAPLEIADGIRRLVGYGWDNKKIAAQLGFKSVKSVADHLEMLAMPEAVQQMVKDGSVSVTTAAKEVRTKGADKATEALTKARDEAKADGKSRIMPKRLREPKEEPRLAQPISVVKTGEPFERPGPEDIEQPAASTGIPMKPGYYWAKWIKACDGTHGGDDLTPATSWEIVQVNDNNLGNPSDDEFLSVSVPGVREAQWRDGFEWGAFVAPLFYRVSAQTVQS
jgi:ParB-like chromosome segregation protein Spo0J